MGGASPTGTTLPFDRSFGVGLEPSIQMYSARYTLMVLPLTCVVGLSDGRHDDRRPQFRQRNGWVRARCRARSPAAASSASATAAGEAPRESAAPAPRGRRYDRRREAARERAEARGEEARLERTGPDIPARDRLRDV